MRLTLTTNRIKRMRAKMMAEMMKRFKGYKTSGKSHRLMRVSETRLVTPT